MDIIFGDPFNDILIGIKGRFKLGKDMFDIQTNRNTDKYPFL